MSAGTRKLSGPRDPRHRSADMPCNAARQILDEMGVGLVIVDAERNVMFASRAAREALRADAPLRLRGGRLITEPFPEGANLQLLIRRMARLSQADTDYSRVGGLKMLGGRQAKVRTCVFVTPLREPHAPRRKRQTVALVLVYRLRAMSISASALVALYGLTAAEGRLLTALLCGSRLSEYAREAHVSMNTAKTHLQHIFAKTGSRRQSELVGQVLANPIMQVVSP